MINIADLLAITMAVRCFDQPHHIGHINRGIYNDAPGRADQQQEPAADRRAHQHTERACRRRQPDTALQLFAANDVVDHHIGGRSPEHTGNTMNDQQHNRMPHFKRVRIKQKSPGQRYQDKQNQTQLNDSPGIELIGQCAGMDREQQERHPMGNHGKTGKHR